jgi:hypothetical protein
VVAHQVEHDAVAPAVAGEVFPGVVDDVVGAERADQLHVSGAAHAGHLRAERLGDLDGEGAHATGGPVDQDVLSGLDPTQVALADQGGAGGQRYRRCLLEGQVGRLGCRSVVGDAHVLGKGAVGEAEVAGHLITRSQPGHTPADRFHPTGEVLAPDLPLGPAEPEHRAGQEARQVRVAPHDVPEPGLQ